MINFEKSELSFSRNVPLESQQMLYRKLEVKGSEGSRQILRALYHHRNIKEKGFLQYQRQSDPEVKRMEGVHAF